MTTWQTTTGTGKLVAHLDGDLLILDFGKYKGRCLQEVPGSYLRWLLSCAGEAFLPPDLLGYVEDEMRVRNAEERGPSRETILRVHELIHWAAVCASVPDMTGDELSCLLEEAQGALLAIEAAMRKRLERGLAEVFKEGGEPEWRSCRE